MHVNQHFVFIIKANVEFDFTQQQTNIKVIQFFKLRMSNAVFHELIINVSLSFLMEGVIKMD